MKYRVTTNGRSDEVDLAALAASSDAHEVEPGVYLIDAGGGHVVEARVAPGTDGAYAVTIRGERFDVVIEDPRSLSRTAGAAGSEGRRKINALMPGKVVRLLVAEGDAVEEGQGLVVVEAMKMQNEMKSPKRGRVVEMTISPGATVAAGETLLIVE